MLICSSYLSTLAYKFMQGIPFFDYKVAQENLDILLQSPDFTASQEYVILLEQHKKNLTETYQQYGSNIKQLSELTKKFEKTKLEIRKLMVLHRKRVKQFQKKTTATVHKPEDMNSTNPS